MSNHAVAAHQITHAEQEAAAYSNWMAAVRRQDHSEAQRLWKVYADVHAQRPAEVVRAMEAQKGLA